MCATHAAMETTKHPLTAYREAKNISLEALGIELGGVNKSTILRWEAGDVLVPIERFEIIERVTGISRSMLRPDIFGPAPASEAAA